MEIMPGVFCDIEGTLFFFNKVKNDVLEMLKKYAETKVITLWSGGDLGEIRERLVANGIKYPLFSKYVYKGARVEIIIDDLPQEEFEKRYKIYSCEYIQVKN